MRFVIIVFLISFAPFGFGEQFVINGTFGNFSSTNFPGPYPDNLNDSWEISVPSGYRVALYFTDFDLEDSFDVVVCSEDYVQIFVEDNRNQSIRLCGNPIQFPDDAPQLQADKFRSKSNKMILRMVSDYANALPFKGFRANFFAEDIDECTELQKLKAMSDDPENVGACEQYCNNYPGGYYCSCRSGYLLHSDGYTCVGECKKITLNDGSGTISSPGYPNPYPRLTDCSWTILSGVGKNVEIKFVGDFRIESHYSIPCPYDYLKIFDSTGQVGSKYCGDVSPGNGTVIRSKTSWFDIEFHSDDLVELKGFKLIYKESTIFCEVPQPPRHGRISHVSLKGKETKISDSKIPFSSIIRFDCDFGFRLIGSGKVECLKDGSLSDDTPTCAPY